MSGGVLAQEAVEVRHIAAERSWEGEGLALLHNLGDH